MEKGFIWKEKMMENKSFDNRKKKNKKNKKKASDWFQALLLYIIVYSTLL